MDTFVQSRKHPAHLSVTVLFHPDKSYTLVGPTVTRPVQDPLDVKLLDNQLCLYVLEIPD